MKGLFIVDDFSGWQQDASFLKLESFCAFEVLALG
jgi:hypothetical protein